MSFRSSFNLSNFAGLAGALRPMIQAGDDKETMRGLNDRLAGYLSKVRLLEESNHHLEEQIQEALLRKGAESERDWSGYEKTIGDLKNQIQDMTMDNARLFLQIDNARLAADDFRVKFESEQAMRQSVEQDLARLRKMLDDTYMGRMQLESQVESMREELAFLKKNHDEDVANLRGQISDSQVNVQMDNKGRADLNDTINSIRAQYERAVQKSREDTETWYQNKFDNITAEVSENTEALQAGKTELNELRRQKQALEIELQGLRNMIKSLEDSLHDVETRYAHEVGGVNGRALQLEAELAQVRAQVERQASEYQTLLNLKMKLEAEIETYHQLLEGVAEDKSGSGSSGIGIQDFALEQALSAAPPPAALEKTIPNNEEPADVQNNSAALNSHEYEEEEADAARDQDTD